MNDNLNPEDVRRRRATEADVILGCIVLDNWRQEGDDRAADELRRIVRSLEPSEFSAGYSALWCAVRKLHAAMGPITLGTLLDTAEAWRPRDPLERSLWTACDTGMALGWSAKDAASRLRAFHAARQRYAEALDTAARALEEMRGTLVVT